MALTLRQQASGRGLRDNLAIWQRCRIRSMRNSLMYASKSGRLVVSAWIVTACAQNAAAAAHSFWRHAAGRAQTS
jgi:transposase-like protein